MTPIGTPRSAGAFTITGRRQAESIDDRSERHVNLRPYAFCVEGEERVIFRIAVSQISTFG